MTVRDQPSPYRMTISRLTIDKLGVRLYDRASAVLAELVANSYDADATEVVIEAPMGEYLATRQKQELVDKGYSIIVHDNGCGMTPEEINRFYLVVGGDRRGENGRGNVSKVYGRKVMGRKGVGKLAPFGICNIIEVLSSGGEIVDGINEVGQPARGYLTAHLLLDRRPIVDDTDKVFEPPTGPLDQTVRPNKGTTITLRNFEFREVPNIRALERQLAQRFGSATSDWRVLLVDSLKTEDDPDKAAEVGEFSVPTMSHTRIEFRGDSVIGPDGNVVTDLRSGFDYDGVFYQITGWVGYAQYPYRDDLMAGVRIYCRHKIAAQTAIFGRGAGFTGEYNVRSYLVGSLDADWLDEEEDLIQTDRRDILWSHPLGRAFEIWGQQVVLRIGRVAREPLKQSTWQQFLVASDIERRIEERFPSEDQAELRRDTLELAKLLVQNGRADEVLEDEGREALVKLSLLFGPHLRLDEALIAAAKDGTPMAAVTSILEEARVAELSSFGRIAEQRIQVINLLERYRDQGETNEMVYQNLIASAPWLIDPQWAPVTSNRSFSTLRRELERFISQRRGEEISLSAFDRGNKRVDFVLHNNDMKLELVEIKPPTHVFDNTDFDRLNNYHELMEEFLYHPNQRQYRNTFSGYRITLVCDDTHLLGAQNTAYNGLIAAELLSPISWSVFFTRAKQAHQEYLQEAERQGRWTQAVGNNQ